MGENQPRQSDRTDELLQLLANQHCRAVLAVFRASPDGAVSVQELANEIRGERDGESNHVVLRLQHSVLPRLAESGVIEYDATRQTVDYHGHAELEELLGIVSERFPEAND